MQEVKGFTFNRMTDLENEVNKFLESLDVLDSTTLYYGVGSTQYGLQYTCLIKIENGWDESDD